GAGDGDAAGRRTSQLPVPMLWLMLVEKPKPRMAKASLSDMTVRPVRPICPRVLGAIPLAALAEPATQTNAAANVERITLLILGRSEERRVGKGPMWWCGKE